MSIRTDSDVSEEIDFIELLPTEIRDKLLLLLDHRSLLNCCYVSKRWNELITSQYNVWKQACLRMPVGKKVLNCDKENWKKMFLQLLNRSRQFQTSECFIERELSQLAMEIKTIYYHNGKIAAGSDVCQAIMIWDCATKELLRTIQYKTIIKSIKFDDNIIMAAFYLGEITSWNLMTGDVVATYHSNNYACCFDYLTDASLVVAGNYDATIIIWNMPSGAPLKVLNGHFSIGIDVMIRPYPCKQVDSKKLAVLFSMDKDELSIRKLSIIVHDDASDEVGVEHMFSIPLSHSQLRYVQPYRGFLTSDVHFDGQFIYFLDRSNDGRADVLCVYDFIGECMARKIDMLVDVEALLGVGKRYAAMIILREDEKIFSVVDMNTNEQVIRYEVPEFRDPRARSFYNNACIGETSWLDGLDGINDKGLVYAAIDPCLTHVFALQWTEK